MFNRVSFFITFYVLTLAATAYIFYYLGCLEGLD